MLSPTACTARASSGAVILMNDTRCMVKSLLRLSYFYFEESCGQCTPCREGTGWLWRVIHRIEHGEGRNEDLDLLNSVADNIQGRTICALGDAAAMPMISFVSRSNLRYQWPDYAAKTAGGYARNAEPI